MGLVDLEQEGEEDEAGFLAVEQILVGGFAVLAGAGWVV